MHLQSILLHFILSWLGGGLEFCAKCYKTIFRCLINRIEWPCLICYFLNKFSCGSFHTTQKMYISVSPTLYPTHSSLSFSVYVFSLSLSHSLTHSLFLCVCVCLFPSVYPFLFWSNIEHTRFNLTVELFEAIFTVLDKQTNKQENG